MGLLDTLFGKTATPVFNPNDPMQGYYDPTDEERRQARKMAALQAGAGMLMNNTGNYGAFAPALGAGIAQGIQGYQQGLQLGPDRRMKEMQQRLYGQQVQAQMKRASQEANDEEQADTQAKLYFAGLGIDPDNMQGSFMPVSGSRPIADNVLDLSAMAKGGEPKQNSSGVDIQTQDPLYLQQGFSAPVPTQPPQIETVLDELGYTQGMKKMFYAHAKSNPQAAQKNLQAEVKDYLKAQRSGRRNTGDWKPQAELADFLVANGVTPQQYMTLPKDERKSIYDQFQGTKIKRAAAGATQNTFAPTIAGEKAMETQGKEFGKFAVEATQAAQSAYDVANDIAMITEGLRGMGGGPIADFKAWVGKIFPADSEMGKIASMSELAKTVQAKLAPQMRAAGSGATSDFEMRMWMQAIPTLSTTENGRELIAKYAQRTADRAQARAEIINDIEQSGRLPTPKEISEGMRRRFGDKFFDDQDRAFFGLKGAAPQRTVQPSTASQSSNGVRKYNPATGRIE